MNKDRNRIPGCQKVLWLSTAVLLQVCASIDAEQCLDTNNQSIIDRLVN